VRSSTRRTILWAATAVAALALVVVAYMQGEEDETGDQAEVGESSLPAPQVPDDPGGGCGAASATDPADLDAAREVARCGAGAPEAEPLPEPTTMRVALTDRSEGAAPLLLADALGEFEAEGLEVEIVDEPSAAAFTSLAGGDVDLVVGPVDAPFFDVVADGGGARQVLGGVLASAPDDTEVAQPGLWYRTDLLTKAGRWDDLAGMPVALDDGVRSAEAYPVNTVFEQGNLSLNDVDVVPMGGTDAADALLEQHLAAAWLDQPAWAEVAEADGYELAVTRPASESIDGTVVSARLLDAERDVGQAYVRAVVRTINTYLTGDYHDDEDVMRALAGALDTDVDDLVVGPSLLFDWEIRSGTTNRMQDVLIELGTVAYERPLAERLLVDRSLVADVVG
jgi:NitT/TauT family transport system substrate-binding protein